MCRTTTTLSQLAYSGRPSNSQNYEQRTQDLYLGSVVRSLAQPEELYVYGTIIQSWLITGHETYVLYVLGIANRNTLMHTKAGIRYFQYLESEISLHLLTIVFGSAEKKDVAVCHEFTEFSWYRHNHSRRVFSRRPPLDPNITKEPGYENMRWIMP